MAEKIIKWQPLLWLPLPVQLYTVFPLLWRLVKPPFPRSWRNVWQVLRMAEQESLGLCMAVLDMQWYQLSHIQTKAFLCLVFMGQFVSDFTSNKWNLHLLHICYLSVVIKSRFESKYVPLGGGQNIWTVKFNPHATKVPLVMVHGFGGGIGLWAMNIDALAKDRSVYAFDVLGFGRSSRPQLSSDPQEAEVEFVDSIEQWRQQMGLDNFVLLGHSFGGYLASSYTLKYPSRVRHLVLVDSWGFPEKPEEFEFNVPLWVKVLVAIVSPFNPLAGLRAAGPWGMLLTVFLCSYNSTK